MGRTTTAYVCAAHMYVLRVSVHISVFGEGGELVLVPETPRDILTFSFFLMEEALQKTRIPLKS